MPNTNTQQRKDIEKVTDYAEEAQVDSSKAGSAMGFLSQKSNSKQNDKNSEANSTSKKNKTAEKIVVNRQDVQFLMDEFLLSKACTEKLLRENRGDIEKTMNFIMTEKKYFR